MKRKSQILSVRATPKFMAFLRKHSKTCRSQSSFIEKSCREYHRWQSLIEQAEALNLKPKQIKASPL